MLWQLLHLVLYWDETKLLLQHSCVWLQLTECVGMDWLRGQPNGENHCWANSTKHLYKAGSVHSQIRLFCKTGAKGTLIGCKQIWISCNYVTTFWLWFLAHLKAFLLSKALRPVCVERVHHSHVSGTNQIHLEPMSSLLGTMQPPHCPLLTHNWQHDLQMALLLLSPEREAGCSPKCGHFHVGRIARGCRVEWGKPSIVWVNGVAVQRHLHIE